MENLYEVLGVERNATKKEIKAAYRKLSKSHHPDTGGDPQVFIQLQVAYEILSDIDTRAHYDATGSVGENTMPLKTAALNIIMGLWDQILNYKCSSNNTDIDMETVFILKLRDIGKDSTRNIKNIKKTLKVLTKISDSIIYKGKENNLLKMFTDDKIKSGELQIRKLERRIKEAEEAEKISEDYDYLYEWGEDECTDDGSDYKVAPKLIGDIMNDFGI